MKTKQRKMNPKKIRRDAKGALGRTLTVEQMERLKDYALSIGASATAFSIERMRGGITVQEAQIFLALADLETAQRCGPDYAD